MARQEIERRLIHILREVLGLAEPAPPHHARLGEDLGADSLDIVQLVLAIEDEFGTAIPEEDAEGFETVSGVLDWLHTYAPA